MGSETLRIREIKPVLSGYISKSRELLKISAVPDEDTIHDIRVFMKKSRAVLKIAGHVNSEGHQDRDLMSLKQVGQIMSHWRDKSVHRKTLRDLRKEYPSLFSKIESDEKIAGLMRKPEEVTEPDEEMKSGIMAIDDLLNKTYFRIRFGEIQKAEAYFLLDQLELSFGAVRNIYLECRNSARPEKIHKFRKRSKDLLYQMYFFRPVNPSRIKQVEKRLERLAMNLGKYNDLYQLLKTIGYVYPDEANPPAMDELVIRIREMQDDYLTGAWKDAYKCFCPGKNLSDLIGFKVVEG
ncbi:MAG: CHAD domain-containing protein [Bacteroidetes bacterium]|nr:CHAD domain-containing protein [Bacteroidota bacterium]